MQNNLNISNKCQKIKKIYIRNSPKIMINGEICPNLESMHRDNDSLNLRYSP
jgi:hypothetical protein